MRHLKHRHTLGLTKEHRAALMANLATELLRHGRIETTLAKAKALRPYVEKVITLAKRAQNASRERSLHCRRLALARVRDRHVVMALFNERVREFMDRPGGYTRIYKLGTRVGDAAEMAIITLLTADDEGYRKSRKKTRKAQDNQRGGETESTVVTEETAASEDVESVDAGEAEATEETVIDSSGVTETVEETDLSESEEKPRT